METKLFSKRKGIFPEPGYAVTVAFRKCVQKILLLRGNEIGRRKAGRLIIASIKAITGFSLKVFQDRCFGKNIANAANPFVIII